MRGVRFYSQSQQALRGWRKYAHQFRDKPASYLTSFAILHELTAIVPLPVVYYFLDYTQLNIPVPEEYIAEGNRVVSKMRTKYGYEPLDSDSRAMVNMVATYAVVKVNFSPHYSAADKGIEYQRTITQHHYIGTVTTSNCCVSGHDTFHGRKSCRPYSQSLWTVCSSNQIIKYCPFQSLGFSQKTLFPFYNHPICSVPSLMGSVNTHTPSLDLSNPQKEDNGPSPPPTPTGGLARNLSVTSLRRTNSTEKKEPIREVINIETPDPSHLYW